MNLQPSELDRLLAALREFVEQEIIPLEPLLLDHQYEPLMAQMEAKRGKARSLGERSLGHVDPGAITTTIILDAMRDHAARAATQR